MEGPFAGGGASVGKVPILEPYGVGCDIQAGTTTDAYGRKKYVDSESLQLQAGDTLPVPVEAHAEAGDTFTAAAFKLMAFLGNLASQQAGENIPTELNIPTNTWP
jgi:hypothetical protein